MDHQEKTPRPLLRQLAAFNVVGIVNTAVTYAVYAVLVLAGMPHLAALAVEYAVGIVLGFWLNRRFTFQSREPWLPGLGRMVAAYVPLLALNEVLLFALVDLAKTDKLLAQGFALVVVSGLSFLVQKTIVFRKKGTPHG